MSWKSVSLSSMQRIFMATGATQWWEGSFVASQ